MINEMDSAKSMADLETSQTITGAKLQTNFEVLDSTLASGLKKIINGDFKTSVFTREETVQKEQLFLTRRQAAWMT